MMFNININLLGVQLLIVMLLMLIDEAIKNMSRSVMLYIIYCDVLDMYHRWKKMFPLLINSFCLPRSKFQDFSSNSGSWMMLLAFTTSTRAGLRKFTFHSTWRMPSNSCSGWWILAIGVLSPDRWLSFHKVRASLCSSL